MTDIPEDVLKAAGRIWMKANVGDDVKLVSAWLQARYPKPPTSPDRAAFWVLTLRVKDAPSRYKSVEDFVARDKNTEHLPLGGRWPDPPSVPKKEGTDALSA